MRKCLLNVTFFFILKQLKPFYATECQSCDPETTKENDFMSKIATCVLTKCDVDYTPDGVRSFDSGAPAAQTMTLEFMETEMLTKEKVQQGF